MQGSARIDELKQKFHENPRRYFAPLANEYRKAGDPEQAIAICRAHLAQQPGHMSGHVVYGQALYDAKRIDEARTVFERALSLDPENVIVLRHLGDIARQEGNTEEARKWYSRALDADPQDTEIAAYLAELTEPLMTSASPTAEASVEQAPAATTRAAEPAEEEKAPEYEPVTAPAGIDLDTLTELEDFDLIGESESEREVALESANGSVDSEREVSGAGSESTQTPASPFVTRTMAELYAQQGHRAAALEIYRQLAASDPQNEELREKIAELSARQTPSSEAPATSAHFTEAELTEGDTWDTDVWGAGFSAEEPAVAEAFAEPDIAREPARLEEDIAAEPASESAETAIESAPAAEEPAAAESEREVPVEAAAEVARPEPAEIAVESAAEAAEAATETAAVAPEEERPPESDIVAYAPPVPEAMPAAPVAQAPEVTTASPQLGARTVRQFFATLGARKPPEIPDRTHPEIAEEAAAAERSAAAVPASGTPSAEYPLADDAFATLFAGSAVSPDDSRAAAALSSAVAHPPRTTPSPTVARPAVPAAPAAEVQESEDDIRRFREWLDGLTES